MEVYTGKECFVKFVKIGNLRNGKYLPAKRLSEPFKDKET